MPLVTVYYRPEVADKNMIPLLRYNLPEIVAGTLSVPGRDSAWKLVSSDILVRFIERGEYDVFPLDVELDIRGVARHEWRSQNHEQLKELILEKVLMHITGLPADFRRLRFTIGVWLVLEDGKWGEVSTQDDART